MTFVRKKRPQLDGTYYTLVELAARLEIPVDHLLEQAAAGWLEVFVRLPDQTTVFSVHEDAIDNDDPLSGISKVVRQVQPPDEIDSRPANMANSSIEGLVLTGHDCREIRAKRCIRQRLFPYGLTTKIIWLESVDPHTPNAFHPNKRLGAGGWRLACYSRYAPMPFLPGIGYAQPMGIDITPANLLVTMRSVETFFDNIDTNKYVEELLCDGKVVSERPPFFSKKLNYLIDVNEQCWRMRTPDSSKEDLSASRLQAKKLMADDAFRSLFGKTKASDIVVDAAISFITPVFARKNSTEAGREAAPGHITPEMLTLIAAAKLFWGPSHVDVSVVDTHPRKQQIDPWLRRMGLKDNDASYGTTILRPEAAAFGRPIPKATKKRSPKLRRPAIAP